MNIPNSQYTTVQFIQVSHQQVLTVQRAKRNRNVWAPPLVVVFTRRQEGGRAGSRSCCRTSTYLVSCCPPGPEPKADGRAGWQ